LFVFFATQEAKTLTTDPGENETSENLVSACSGSNTRGACVFSHFFRSLIILSSIAAPGISAKPHDDNVRYFDVIITGPSSTPYQSE
jgi:hypothetical protein